MQYRSDIDGLRAIAVLLVIMFHSGIAVVSGGYIGVDVFFVISGYLITTLIYKEIKEGSFTFTNFYKRRAARLLPALSITLFAVLCFGFIFYNNQAFDNLGKEIFFSSFGAANILFSQGVNYFVKNEAYQPLIHLWSLGVEEQFYIIWPILLLITCRLLPKAVILLVCALFFVSLCLSVSSVKMELIQGYFLLQYRAFELLVGVVTALIFFNPAKNKINDLTRQIFSYIGLALIFIPAFFLDKNSNFPGFNALWPCIGTACIIAFPNKGVITRILSYKASVFIGVISYPLYLYHQPIISFIHYFDISLNSIEIFITVITISVLLSWLTYKYVETPIRKVAHSKNGGKQSFFTVAGLVLTIPFFAVIGIVIAKSGGLEERFKYLNPFALEISKAHSTTFHQNFERGFKIANGKHGKALFVGDSVLQHYVLPITLALGLEPGQIDSVTRGGCVMLKGVDFKDSFSDVSCNGIRKELYKSTKTYDYVIVSQAWSSYGASMVMNFPKDIEGYKKWLPFLNSTIEHFSTVTDNIIIIGGHPFVSGTLELQPSIAINKDKFKSRLKKLEINNMSDLRNSLAFFNRYKRQERIKIIDPYSVFCEEGCLTNNGTWSYFSDSEHMSVASTDFVVERIKVLLKKVD